MGLPLGIVAIVIMLALAASDLWNKEKEMQTPHGLRMSKEILRDSIRARFEDFDYDSVLETDDGLCLKKGKHKFIIEVREEKEKVKS
jgi:hypothetical protein